MLRHYFGIIPRALWKLFFVLNFVCSMIILYPVFALLLTRESNFPKAFALMRVWARWVLHVPGIFLKTEREQPPHHGGPCVYVANHASYLDIVVSYIVIPHYFVYMGKLEIDKAPLLRIFFRERKGRAGMNIYVDRKTRAGSYKAFRQAGEKLASGQSVFIYPEGTIESNGRLKNFKNGAFRLAIEHQVPVVPVTFLNNWRLLQNGGFFKSTGRPGLAKVIVHKPVPTRGMTEEDLVNLRHQVRQTIAQTLRQS
ncbi:MAG: 1-acyl-sn-glycerol-3-phosphate acyltransferase [Bacteroidia bacterium]|jgi:1-acyl-sn-glycerol-3-phosphate acyltransferase|nr:1-acyl-sn-glycerol-3-phosphate acyltransferase [Bacteroidia bacterium]